MNTALSDTDGGGGDGGDGGGADGASECPANVSSLAGTACHVEGQTCGGSQCTDPCSFCNLVRCTGGTWTQVESFPGSSCADASDASSDAADAGPLPFDFPCGASGAPDGGPLQCFFPTQFCEESGGGAPPLPDSGPTVGYACKAFPSACESNPTCACLMASPSVCGGGGGQAVACTDNGGGPTVQCAYP